MSILGNKPISIPKDTKVKVEGGRLVMTGPKGSKELTINDKIFTATLDKDNILSSLHESPLIMLVPSCLLAIGAILAGFLFKEMFIGHDNSEFWSNSILFLEAFERSHPPTWLLITTPLTVILIIPISYYLFVENEKILKNFVLKNQFLYNFLLNKWYFDELYNFIFVEPLKKIGLFLWRKGDINTIDRYGPDGLSRLIKIISD